MKPIEIARKMAELGQKADAAKAYLLVLHEADGKKPEEELEAATYLFASKADYQAAYTTFVSLYGRGFHREGLLSLMEQAFYQPSIENQRRRYEDNCRRLARYPYLFRRDFLPFDELPIAFFPFNDKGFLPFYRAEGRFGSYINFNDTVIDRWFFKDMENPILADDIYSQYQLEYLNDTVRKSEWVGRENHIYLHYTDWTVFCSYLQCLSFKKLMDEKKFVFLIEDEIQEYPIDFKARFGIDYSECPPHQIEIREVKRLIWHTQLSTHNGGDFFNEIFYGHPNLLALDSIMFENIQESVEDIQKALRQNTGEGPMFRKLRLLHNPTPKDCLVAMFLYSDLLPEPPDPRQRIAPALFFQPHFGNMVYSASVVNEARGWTQIYSKQYEEIHTSPLFQGFKYIKTFTPMRRITTSYAASLRFMLDRTQEEEEGVAKVIPDVIQLRMLNRSYLVDEWDRLYRDSVLVRFEDGKLNPRATFSALAEFLDLPYTESMTYCKPLYAERNAPAGPGNVGGFDPASVYRTYDEYINDDERAFLEYFFRDAYRQYGYEFQYYGGELVDEEWVRSKVERFSCADGYIARSWEEAIRRNVHITLVQDDGGAAEESTDEGLVVSGGVQGLLDQYRHDRVRFASYLLKGLYFVNRRGQPLKLMRPLKLDPALLEQPLYH